MIAWHKAGQKAHFAELVLKLTIKEEFWSG